MCVCVFHPENLKIGNLVENVVVSQAVCIQYTLYVGERWYAKNNIKGEHFLWRSVVLRLQWKRKGPDQNNIKKDLYRNLKRLIMIIFTLSFILRGVSYTSHVIVDCVCLSNIYFYPVFDYFKSIWIKDEPSFGVCKGWQHTKHNWIPNFLSILYYLRPENRHCW